MRPYQGDHFKTTACAAYISKKAAQIKMASIRLLFLSFALIMIIVTTSARPMNSGNFLRQRRGVELSDMIREVNESNRQKRSQRSRGNMVLSLDYLLKALEKTQREQTAESQRNLMDAIGR
ncbi:uncharacterized protein LOC117123185 [Anneissia japonica]|uniref:uncharacterized protein LOC117123185 n=1 Tax=Anneissia japonica TaxID=1529436 RepID=UPI0014254C79|nr:uncharacterized protein LOC117123185 [Anneissia japonica]